MTQSLITDICQIKPNEASSYRMGLAYPPLNATKLTKFIIFGKAFSAYSALNEISNKSLEEEEFGKYIDVKKR